MAKLKVSDNDYTKKLKDFSLSCNKCESQNVTLDIDCEFFFDTPGIDVLVICEECKKETIIFKH